MECNHGFSGAGAPGNLHRAVEVPVSQIPLGWMQKNQLRVKWRLEHLDQLVVLLDDKETA